MAAGIIDDGGAELRAVFAAHDKRANRVCSVINAEGKHRWDKKNQAARANVAGKPPDYMTVM
jgi:hypothetical protein